MPNPTSADHQAALIAEWSVYKANGPIYINGVLAFNDGDPVPKGHVEAYDRDTTDENGQWTGVIETIEPVVDLDSVVRVDGKAHTKAAVSKSAESKTDGKAS